MAAKVSSERAHARLRAQQVAASALAEAGSLDAMPTILRAVCHGFGWEWGVFWRVDATLGHLGCQAVWHERDAPELAEQFHRTVMTVTEVCLPARVWASGRPVWAADVATDDDRTLAPIAHAAGLHTACGFPVRAGGAIIGVLEFFSRDVRLLDEETIVTLAAIGAQVGHLVQRTQGAVDQTVLYEIAGRARAEAEAESHRLAFLANASALLSSAIDYRSTLELLPRRAASRLADWCVLDVDEPHGERVSVVVARSELSAEESRLLPGYPGSRPSVSANPPLATPASTPGDETRERVILVEAADHASLAEVLPDGELLELARRVGTSSLLRIPLRTRGRAFGTLTLLRTGATTAFAAADLALAQELAFTAAITIEKARLQRESDEALRIRNKVLSVVSHDLRNPLQVIDLNVEMLSELVAADESSPAMQELARGLARVRRASVRMNAMIRELIDVAQLQAGQPLALDRRPTDLVVLLRHIVDEFQQSWKDRRILLTCDARALVGDFDAQRIERAIANLVSNAVKYSLPGSAVRVSLGHEPGQAVIAVVDSGPGMPATMVASLFDVFRRVSSEENHRAGAGIGLASAHQVVTAHGGTIAVSSTLGEGTALTVRLPLAAPVVTA
jgi:signal transduction histidine kinase